MYACQFFDKSWHKEIIRGKWIDGTDGGCTNFKHFYRNPNYVLDVEENDTKLFIMLLQEKQKLSDGKELRGGGVTANKIK